MLWKTLSKGVILVPTYVYKCTLCEKVVEVDISSSEKEEFEAYAKCESCGGILKRKLAPFVTHFNYTRGK
jgi:predicted nucleic acid-binding Zn ribbon protein